MLTEVIDGFDSLDLVSAGQNVRVLSAKFVAGADATVAKKRRLEFDFDELSDGQRALIALYTLLLCAVRLESTICIDEPDNFIALAEIQPWLFELSDRIDDEGAQVILVSHHPELINQLAPDHGVRFERIGFGPVRVDPYKRDPGIDLSPSELIARGWDRG